MNNIGNKFTMLWTLSRCEQSFSVETDENKCVC